MTHTDENGDARNSVLVPDIQHSTPVRATPDQVFALLSSGAGWDKWFTDGSTFDAVAGSPVHLVWRGLGSDGGDLTDDGEVKECVPGKRFAFTWGTPSSLVTFTTEEHPHGTRLQVVESGLPQTRAGLERFSECATGWGEALTLLRCYAEHGIRLSTT
ncbi:SRPBCC domain-containing protein [Streptomyces sp. NPDC020965]|uniref:SRPBCC domain-containing protein n=1 Tax=Streptomyces sp. NPDC020965 TaxID=3365105 RepID=UPI0037B38901